MRPIGPVSFPAPPSAPSWVTSGIGGPAGSGQSATSGKSAATENPAEKFAKLLVDEVKNVNQMQTQANDNVHSLLTGGDVNQAEVLTSVQKADLAFRMLLQVRNKLVEAYREVQQIQI